MRTNSDNKRLFLKEIGQVQFFGTIAFLFVLVLHCVHPVRWAGPPPSQGCVSAGPPHGLDPLALLFGGWVKL